jgi:hypothetical protein
MFADSYASPWPITAVVTAEIDRTSLLENQGTQASLPFPNTQQQAGERLSLPRSQPPAAQSLETDELDPSVFFPTRATPFEADPMSLEEYAAFCVELERDPPAALERRGFRLPVDAAPVHKWFAALFDRVPRARDTWRDLVTKLRNARGA